MNTKTLRLNAISFTLLSLLSIFIVGLGSVLAAPATLDNTSPSGANTDPTGAAVFLLRKQVNNGRQQDVNFSVYLPPSANTGNTELRLDPNTSINHPRVCDASGSPSNQYIRVTIRPYQMPGQTRTFYVDRDRVCVQGNVLNQQGTNANNILYGRYPFPNISGSGPGNAIDSRINMRRFDVTIEYGPPYSQVDGTIRMLATIPTNPNALVSPGTGSFAFPTVGDWDRVVAGPAEPYSHKIPFGYCNASGGTIATSIGVYDADNPVNATYSFWPYMLNFKIFDRNTGQYVPLSTDANSRGAVSGGVTFTPTPGATNGQQSYALLTLDQSHFYEMQIEQIHIQNTIDIQLPNNTEAAYGLPSLCTTIPPPPASDAVIIRSTAIANPASAEVGGSVTFEQGVQISNFPGRPSQWGFNEEARRRADQSNVAPVRSDYDARNAGNTGQTATALRECWDFNYRASCTAAQGGYRCHNGAQRTPATGCGAGVGYYRWRCEWNGKVDPATGWVNQQNAPSCRSIDQYQCRDAAGNWQDQFRDFPGRAYLACGNQYNCWAPSGMPTIYYDPGAGSGYCRIFHCAYDASVNFYSPPGNNGDDQCDKRCSNGAGARAPNWNPPGSLDDNCYIQPQFTVTCQWQGTGLSESYVVTADGNYCGSADLTLPASSRGQLCAVTFANYGTGWQGTPPGKGVDGNVNATRVRWDFSLFTPASACAQVGQRPYFHVYGGDVNAKTSFMPCTAPNTTTIQAFNNGTPTWTGSGSQLAAIARGAIDGFSSSSIGTQKPYGLTFANTTGGWGGSYGGTLDCIPDDDFNLPLYGGSNTIAGGVITGQDWRNYGNQDVYITGNITYPANFSLTNIPSLKIITTGNIYVQYNVNQLNGTYMTKGKIYTCAVGVGTLRAPDATEMAQYCETTPLRVNGSFIANQVKLLRTIGSVGYAPLDPRNGTGLQTAAEYFTYTPDTWVRNLGIPVTSNELPTESMVNLPPVL